MSTVRILVGDCVRRLKELPDNSIQCCVTSPPYWGLRDYGADGQLGLEATPQEFVASMVRVFDEVRRVLRPDGVCFVNLGDSYKDKQLQGIPWRVALALQADGWRLRQEIIWHKPNPMPEAATDRCTCAHEAVFLLTKLPRYFWDQKAIAEPAVLGEHTRSRASNFKKAGSQDDKYGSHNHGAETIVCDGTRNARSVWTITTKPYSGAHFATFPPELPMRCIGAGSKKGDTVLDPFFGAGTTGLVAMKMGRNAIGCELNADYAELARERIAAECGLFGSVRVENPCAAG